MNESIAILIGFIFIVVGILAMRSYILKLKRLRAKGLEVTAIITEINGMSDNEKAIISYDVMGEQHVVELGYYSNRMRVGDEVILYVDKNNPENFIYDGKGPIILSALFIIVGILWSALFIIV